MKPSTCPFDPEPLIGMPLGMFHCPGCLEMVIAGLPHPGEMEESDYKALGEMFDGECCERNEL